MGREGLLRAKEAGKEGETMDDWGGVRLLLGGELGLSEQTSAGMRGPASCWEVSLPGKQMV
jgi:hypothetical protein